MHIHHGSACTLQEVDGDEEKFKAMQNEPLFNKFDDTVLDPAYYGKRLRTIMATTQKKQTEEGQEANEGQDDPIGLPDSSWEAEYGSKRRRLLH